MNNRERLSTEEQWNAFFKEGGQWEINGGCEQTRLFAEAFCKHTKIKRLGKGQSILDSSCALGDALPVFKRYYPKAKLYGCDFSSEAIERSKIRFPDIALFFQASFEEIAGIYDVIFSSATLEHFLDYKEIARTLLQRCRYLCILVPYKEMRFGKSLEYKQDSDHVVTFQENSFDYLVDENIAKIIFPPKILSVPKAWSWTPTTLVYQSAKNLFRVVANKPILKNRKMILYEIQRAE